MPKTTVGRLWLLRKQKKGSSLEEEHDGGIMAWKAKLGAPPPPPPQWDSCALLLAFLAITLTLMVVLAGMQQHEAQKAELWRRHEASLGLKPAAAHDRAAMLGGSADAAHHSSLWDAACEDATGGTLPRRVVLQQEQMTWLVKEGVYKRNGVHQPAQRCRSDAPPGQPLPQLRRVVLLKSAKPRPPGGVTVMTQLSLERLGMLQQQCSAWPHPIAAAVYIPLLHGRVASADDPRLNGSTLDASLVPLLEMHATAEKTDGGCILDVEVVVEVHCSTHSASLYPANAARNRALHLVETEAVVLLDVDFVPSASLAARMADHQYRTVVLGLLQQPLALVLPAFQTTGGGEEDAELGLLVAHRGKAELLQQCREGGIQPFHSGQYSKGHRATDFKRWATATHVYEIEFQTGFEPYILIARKHVPWYDERCRGYYVNKLMHALHLDSLGVRWAVHPGGFVVHLPHKTAAMKGITRDSGRKEFNNLLFARAMGQMRANHYLPFVSDPQLCYSSRLWDASM